MTVNKALKIGGGGRSPTWTRGGKVAEKEHIYSTEQYLNSVAKDAARNKSTESRGGRRDEGARAGAAHRL